ncbi:MAG: Co2+/Mg2+ efflux protein ApaG [Candidatus Hydrogenedentes bacterium]|nr:Co2+/Mg2+ efflux protein ApaG [Candidatus Hydrogenedentota bacterium]
MTLTLTKSDTITHRIRVQTESFYVPERSDPRNLLYFFAYRIRITNEGADPVQLISRHWIITDGHGQVEEVRGAGVVGEQPRLAPGETFEYTSACPLHTRFGTMQGTYHMIRDNRVAFEAEIGQFNLLHPAVLN